MGISVSRFQRKFNRIGIKDHPSIWRFKDEDDFSADSDWKLSYKVDSQGRGGSIYSCKSKENKWLILFRSVLFHLCEDSQP